ncbi:MAG TPA: hypothetical protein VNZ22_04670, partial [Bacillota bacterium]|nr:hypothetical protein [Bacillota bacterium]
MSDFEFSCSNCGQHLTAGDDWVGRHIRAHVHGNLESRLAGRARRARHDAPSAPVGCLGEAALPGRFIQRIQPIPFFLRAANALVLL